MWKFRLASVMMVLVSGSAFVIPFYECNPHSKAIARSGTDLHAFMISRRDTNAIGLANVIIGIFPSLVQAAAVQDVPTAEDLKRIKVGHDQVLYLLNNFEAETTGKL
jgi:hypothetical protein